MVAKSAPKPCWANATSLARIDELARSKVKIELLQISSIRHRNAIFARETGLSSRGQIESRIRIAATDIAYLDLNLNSDVRHLRQ